MFLRVILPLFLTMLVTTHAFAEEEYSLPDLDGNPHNLSEQKGKWLVMNFWATWCAPCIHEMPELQAFYDNNRDIANVWGVTFEETPIAAIRDFVQRLKVSYPIVGKEGDPRTPFGQVRVLPTTFIIDPNGKFYQRIEGVVTAEQLESIISDADIKTTDVRSLSV